MCLNNIDGTLVESNEFTRPARTNVSTYYGVYLISVNKNTVISKNRFHNGFGGSTSTTTAAYVIYFSSSDAPAGSENIVKNSLIYDINTNGTIYALYNIGTSWSMPAGTINPWTVNPDNFSAAYICFSPAGGAPNDPLWLSFDLKQTFKTANANTNFRVTINGTQVGATYRPPFSGTPI